MKEHPDRIKKLAMKTNQAVFEHPNLYNIVGIIMRRAIKLLPKGILYNKLNIWGKQRDLPNVPSKSFKEWYNERSEQ
tara:strand:- start:222 stop:452 length:231 start_codon:yes stop_codon:yes gene_type:complete